MSDDLLSRILRRIGRTAHPLFDPDDLGRRSRDAERETKRSIEKLSTEVARLTAQVDRIAQRVDRFDTRQAERLQEAVTTLGWSTRRQMAFADRLLQRAHVGQEHEFLREHALRRLRNLQRSKGPVLVGPWTGEVGFELLYWVPFVRWALERFSIDPERVTLVSRGGTRSWYGLDEARYIDILERRSPEALRDNSEHQKKQRFLRAFDRQVIRDLAAELGARPGLLHPALMYALFMPFWKQKTSLRWVEEHVRPARITAPRIEGLTLPDAYVAVRFYFSDCFPDTPENRILVKSVVEALAREHEVVLLGSGVQLDEHRDVQVEDGVGRVHVLDHLLKPETNLALQTAVIAGASAFVGTYGGFSYLAPLCGVDAVAIYSVNNFYEHHLDFGQWMFAQVGGGSLTVVDAAMRDLVGAIARKA